MASIAFHQIASHLVVMSCHGRPSRVARSMILSSMSVMFETCRTVSPVHSRYRRNVSYTSVARPWPR
ncbi:MAG: hypothetical protein R2715_15335 [Ilumatobacteraceae bacterium]